MANTDEIKAAMAIQQRSAVPVVCLVRDFGEGPWLWVWPPGSIELPDVLAPLVLEAMKMERNYRDRFIKLAVQVGFDEAAEQTEKSLATVKCRVVRIGTLH